jgi:Spy/CpxP family protein refolding chaperone
MLKRNVILILSVIFFTFSQGCKRDSSVREYSKSHFKHSHDRSHKDISRFGFVSIERMAKELNLSEGQIEELKKIENEMSEKRSLMRQERKERENIKIKIVDLIRKDSLSREEVLSFMNELHSLKEEERMKMDSLIAERLARVHSVLTEEQREKLAQKIEEFEPNRKFKPEKK